MISLDKFSPVWYWFSSHKHTHTHQTAKQSLNSLTASNSSCCQSSLIKHSGTEILTDSLILLIASLSPWQEETEETWRNIATNGGTILIYHTKGHLGDSWCHVCSAYLCLWSFHDLYDIRWYTIYVIWCDLHRWISICLAIKSGAQIRISRKECLHLAIGIAFQSK